jgi:hypothetical protein
MIARREFVLGAAAAGVLMQPRVGCAKASQPVRILVAWSPSWGMRLAAHPGHLLKRSSAIDLAVAGQCHRSRRDSGIVGDDRFRIGEESGPRRG